MQTPPATDPDAANERAVSPVIGVILMVAITVILAAVIGTFVLNLGGQVQENVQAGASVSFDSANDEVRIRFTSNQNADHLNVSVTNDSQTSYFELRQPGDGVTTHADSDETLVGGASETGPSNHPIWTKNGEDVSVVVTAVKGDTSTVVASKSDTL